MSQLMNMKFKGENTKEGDPRHEGRNPWDFQISHGITELKHGDGLE